MSGKVRRGIDVSSLTPGSRLAWTSAKSGRRNQSHSDLAQYADTESVWGLLERMEEIAKTHSEALLCVIFKFFNISI